MSLQLDASSDRASALATYFRFEARAAQIKRLLEDREFLTCRIVAVRPGVNYSRAWTLLERLHEAGLLERELGQAGFRYFAP